MLSNGKASGPEPAKNAKNRPSRSGDDFALLIQ